MGLYQCTLSHCNCMCYLMQPKDVGYSEVQKPRASHGHNRSRRGVSGDTNVRVPLRASEHTGAIRRRRRDVVVVRNRRERGGEREGERER